MSYACVGRAPGCRIAVAQGTRGTGLRQGSVRRYAIYILLTCVLSGVRPVAAAHCDVWSLGVVLYELCAGFALFHKSHGSGRLVKSMDRLQLAWWVNLSVERQNNILQHTSGPAEQANTPLSSSHMIKHALILVTHDKLRMLILTLSLIGTTGKGPRPGPLAQAGLAGQGAGAQCKDHPLRHG